MTTDREATMSDPIDADRLTTSEPVARLESLAEFLDHQIEEAAAMQKASFDRRCVNGDKQGERWHARQCAFYEVQLKLKALENAAPSLGVRSALEKLTGAMRFVLAFYEPGQRYLDTNAWKNAEASARSAFKKAEEALSVHRAPQDEMRSGEGRHGIYIASKTRHADRWKAMRAAGATIISTWIDEAGVGESPDLNDLWVRCISESATCAVLIVYRELHDVLKGAWIELGVALARGTPVFAVGLREYTVAHYHGIRHFDTIEEAFDVARAALKQGDDK